MSIIEANITIDADEDIDVAFLVSQIEQIFIQINNKPSQVDVVDMDNAITNSPLNYR